MPTSAFRKKTVYFATAALAVAALAFGHRAKAEGDDQTAFRERCATRVAIALTDESASAELFASEDPQASVDTLLKTDKFRTRFARFINATFNDDPGTGFNEEAPYYLMKYVLEKDLPYKDLFVGPFDVKRTGEGKVVTAFSVVSDGNGLGYFRNRAWSLRYAGNEGSGLRLVTAYRILNNVLGVELVATTNAPDADLSAAGRKSPACAGCHFEPWYALDEVASVLTRRSGTGNATTFVPSPTGPKSILGGITIADDRQLVETLVGNEAFPFRACRLAFKFLYGRPENQCEGALFDKCVDAFKSDGKIQTAVATIAKDASFCE